MNIFTKLVKVAAKIVVLPAAIAVDAVKVVVEAAVGKEPSESLTKKLLDEIEDDVNE